MFLNIRTVEGGICNLGKQLRIITALFELPSLLLFFFTLGHMRMRSSCPLLNSSGKKTRMFLCFEIALLRGNFWEKKHGVELFSCQNFFAISACRSCGNAWLRCVEHISPVCLPWCTRMCNCPSGDHLCVILQDSALALNNLQPCYRCVCWRRVPELPEFVDMLDKLSVFLCEL